MGRVTKQDSQGKKEKKKMEKMKKILTIALILLCLFMIGCGKEEKQEEGKEEIPEKEQSYESVGNESEDALQVLLTNQTGLEITGMSVKSSQEAEYPANMLRGGQTVSPDEKVMFYYTVEEKKEEPEAPAQNEGDGILSDAVVNITYSLQVTCADGTILEATLFPIEDMSEAALCYEEEVLYLTYKSKTDESQVSTKEAEAVAVYNKKVAVSVAEQIQQLGEVTLESEEAIRAARAAYDSLPEEVKPQVQNVEELLVKEYQLEELRQQAIAQWEAEQQAAQKAAEEQAAQRAAEEAARQQQAAQQQQGNGNANGGGYQADVGQRTDGCLDDVVINEYD